MPSIQFISSSAQHVDSQVNLMRDSRDGCACMELDFVIGEFVNLANHLREVDLLVMRELFTGKVEADALITPPLGVLYQHVTHAHPYLLEEARLFEAKGYTVKRVDELRAFNSDDIGLFAILRTERGEDVPPPANLKKVLDEISKAA